jgi:hypothetical protein
LIGPLPHQKKRKKVSRYEHSPNERLCSILFGLIYRVYKGRILGKGMPMREKSIMLLGIAWGTTWELMGNLVGAPNVKNKKSQTLFFIYIKFEN